MTTIIAAVAAAVLAGTFAVIGALVGAATQRKTWLRAQRLESATEVLVAADQVLARIFAATTPEEKWRIYNDGADDLLDLPARGRLILVGDARTEDAIRELIYAMGAAHTDEPGSEYGAVRGEFVRNMRRLIHA